MGSFGRLLTDTPDANTPSDPPNEWKGKPGAPQGFNPPKPDLSSWPLLLRAMPQTNKDVLTPNFRCGRDGWKPHSDTRTATVLAGDAVGFLPERYSTGTNQERVSYDSIAHIGPGMAYLAKKPDGVELSQWDGDGDWFKIDYTGPSSDESWVLLGAKQYNGTGRLWSIPFRESSVCEAEANSEKLLSPNLHHRVNTFYA